MILLAFLLPLAIYLLVLANLNGREHPVAISGAWDFAGVVFASSGFLMFGLPAILGAFSETGRRWLWLGETEASPLGEEYRQVWMVVYLAYVALIVLGAGVLIWRRRRCTAVYNVTSAALELAIERACGILGLSPVRSGNLFLFGMAAGWGGAGRRGAEGLQAPHYTAPADANLKGDERATLAASELLAQSAVLEVEAFATMRHATLWWDPASATVRPEVERELDRLLAELPVPDYAVCAWQSLLAQVLFAGIFFGALAVLAYRMFVG